MRSSTKGAMLDRLRDRLLGLEDEAAAGILIGVVSRVARLWTRSFDGLVSKGQTHTPPEVDEDTGEEVEAAFVWRLGATEDHCVDCLNLDGQVHTAAEWLASGIQPQSPDLACGGWNCDCRLEPTELPSSGGVV